MKENVNRNIRFLNHSEPPQRNINGGSMSPVLKNKAPAIQTNNNKLNTLNINVLSSSKPVGLNDAIFYENLVQKTQDNSNSQSINKSPISAGHHLEFVDQPIPLLSSNLQKINNHNLNQSMQENPQNFQNNNHQQHQLIQVEINNKPNTQGYSNNYNDKYNQNQSNNQKPAPNQQNNNQLVNSNQYQEQIKAAQPPPPQKQVRDFQMEIERRYDRSVANQTFQMPQLEDSGDEDDRMSDSSYQSLQNVTLYNLQTQNLQRKLANSIKNDFKINHTISVNHNRDNSYDNHYSNTLKTQGDEPSGNGNHYSKNNTSSAFRQTAVLKPAQQIFPENLGMTQKYINNLNMSQIANNNNNNKSIEGRVNPKILNRDQRYESEYSGEKNPKSQLYVSNSSHGKHKYHPSASPFTAHQGTSNLNKNITGYLVKTENFQFKGKQGTSHSTSKQAPHNLSVNYQNYNAGLRVATEGTEPVSYKENGSGLNKATYYYQKAQGDIYQQFRLQTNSNKDFTLTNQSLSQEKNQSSHLNNVSQSFHFKTNSKKNYNDSNLDRLSTLQSLDQNTIGIDDLSINQSNVQKNFKQQVLLSSDRNQQRDFVDIQAYINTQLKKQNNPQQY